MSKTKLEEEIATGMGLIFLFGFPGIAWAFFGWKWALVVFVLGQFLIYLVKAAKVGRSKPSTERKTQGKARA